MLKLYSHLIGLPLITEYSNRPLALIQDIIVHPDDGRVLALLLPRTRIVVPADIERITDRGIYIEGVERILPLHEVSRVEHVFNMEVSFIGARVVTETTKRFLGRIFDIEFDSRLMQVYRIYFSRQFLLFRYQQRIVSRDTIVRVEKGILYIKEPEEKVAEKAENATAPSSAFA